MLCAICEKCEGTIEAIADDEEVLVCADCMAYEMGDEVPR